MNSDRPYCSVILHYVPNGTRWHPTESKGPWSTITHGYFRNLTAADKWAAENIPGHTYEIRVYW